MLLLLLLLLLRRLLLLFGLAFELESRTQEGALEARDRIGQAYIRPA